MYKHMADTLIETEEKVFVSLDEKNKFKTYPNKFISNDETYTKDELDRFIGELQVKDVTVEGETISESDTTPSIITDFEIYGKTVQRVENINNDVVLTEGAIRDDTGVDIASDITNEGYVNVRSGFLEVKYRDKLQYKSNEIIRSAHIYLYDSNKNFIKYCGIISSEYVIDNVDVKFIRIRHWNLNADNTKLHIERTHLCDIRSVGEKVSDNSYKIKVRSDNGFDINSEDYQKNVTYLYTPVQLESVGNIRDRLFKREDGVWCIEKNIGEFTFTRNDILTNDGHSYKVLIPNLKMRPYWNKAIGAHMLINKSQYIIESDEFNAGIYMNTTYSSYIISDNLDGSLILSIYCYDNISDVDVVTLLAPCVEPEIIELPLDVQLSLNSFHGITNITVESGDVQGTLKVKLPKSINSSIDSLVKKTDEISKNISSLKELKNGQTIDYITKDSFVNISESNNGVVDDIKLEGQTLINLLPADWGINYVYGDNSIATDRSLDYYRITKLVHKIKPSTTYTVIANVIKNTVTSGQYFTLVDKNQPGDYIGSTQITVDRGFTGLFVAKFVSNEVIDDDTLQKTYLRTTVECVNPGTVELSHMMIIEGDHTDKPLSYFEGLKSVGDGVESIKIKSSKYNLLNLLDYEPTINGNAEVKISLEEYDSSKIKLKTLTGNTSKYPSVWFSNVKFIPGKRYRVKAKVTKSESGVSPIFSIRVAGTPSRPHKDMYPNSNGYINETFVATNMYHRIEFFGGNHMGVIENTEVLYEDIQITLEDEHDFTTPAKNEKELYFINKSNELEKVVLRAASDIVYDYIIKHEDGKYYYHKRCEEIILDEHTPDLVLNDTYTLTNTLHFQKQNISNNAEAISDKFIQIMSANMDLEGIIPNSPYRNISVKILKSKLATHDVDGFRTWLADNNIRIVYGLAQEEVYECVDLTLNLYDKNSTIICEPGYIAPKMTVSIASYIGNIVNNIKDRVSKLENNVYEKYLFQNKMMLQNMYSSDNTLLKVNIEMTRTGFNSTTEDLGVIELIVKNIEVGIGNYNRLQMEEIIDFYTMVGKISFETANILFDLMEEKNTAN